jgi:hypothetical protein
VTVALDAFLCVFLGLIVLASPMPPQKDSEARSKLRTLLDEAWEFELREDPLLATSVGDSRCALRVKSAASRPFGASPEPPALS